MSRRKSKRVLVVFAAALAVLTAGGGAAFAFSDLNVNGESAATAAVIPDAETTRPWSPSAEADPQRHDEAQEQRDEVVAQALRSTQIQAEEPRERDRSDAGGGHNTGGLTPTGESGQCEASMYGDPQPTASGETFDPSAMTAAHKTLPFDTMVEVTNIANDKSVTVRINDRGPYIAGRCLDLSTAAFSVIASPSQGVVQVKWRVVS